MRVYKFGSFRLDVTERTLTRRGRLISLPNRLFDLLAVLVESRGRLVTKNELIEKIWADSIVEDSNLTVSIARIRTLLRDDRRHPKYILTVPRSGYRFISKVHQKDGRNGSSIAVLALESNNASLPAFVQHQSGLNESTEVPNVLAAGEQRLPHHPESSETYRAYLKGRFYWSKRSEAGLHKSIGYFTQAITLDPNYALAHAGLADSYNMLGFYSMLAPTDSFPTAIAAANMALSIDDNLAEPHAALGFAKFLHEWDWPGAEQCFKRSKELNPNYVPVRLFYGCQLAAMGRFGEAIAEYEFAVHLDPLSFIANAALGYGYYFARLYDRAIEQCKVAIDLDEHFEAAHVWCGWAYQQKSMWDEAFREFEKALDLSGARSGITAAIGTAYALSGNKKQARKVLADLRKLASRKYVSPYRVACIHAALGDVDKAFHCLEQAYQDRSHLLVNLQVDPRLDSLRSDPRLAGLIERVTAAPCFTQHNGAFLAFVQGRSYWSQHTEAGLVQAIEQFRHAIDLDDSYVSAYAALIDCYLRLSANYFFPAGEREKRSLPAQIRTIAEISPDVRAALRLRDQWDLATTEREIGRAKELKSNLPSANQWRSAYFFVRKICEEKLDRANQEILASTRALDATPGKTLTSGTGLGPDEEVQVFCIIARDQVQAGNTEAGCLLLQHWFKVGEWPRLEGLSQQSSANLLLTAGLLGGRLGTSRQLPRGQIHAEALINGALGLFEQLGLKTRAAECKSELGRCYDREGKFDLARTNFVTALEEFPADDLAARVKCLRRLAFAEMKMGHLHESLSRLEEAGRIVTTSDPTTSMFFNTSIATTLGELAIAEHSTKYFDLACKHYNEALVESEAVGHHKNTGVVESNHGYLLLAFGKLREAEVHLLRARSLFDHFSDLTPSLDETIARLYLKMEQFDLAEKAILRSVVVLEKGDEEALLAESLRTHGRILCKLNRRREARRVFDRAYQIADLCGDHEGAGLALLLMIEELSDQFQDDELVEALSLLDVLLGQSQRPSIIERLTNCREVMRHPK